MFELVVIKDVYDGLKNGMLKANQDAAQEEVSKVDKNK